MLERVLRCVFCKQARRTQPFFRDSERLTIQLLILLEIIFAKSISVIVDVINYVKRIPQVIVALITSPDRVACVASRDRQLLQNIFGELILSVIRPKITSRIA